MYESKNDIEMNIKRCQVVISSVKEGEEVESDFRSILSIQSTLVA